MLYGKKYGGPIHCQVDGHMAKSTEYCANCMVVVCPKHSITCEQCGAVWCLDCADVENGLCLDCIPYSDGGALVCEGCGGECQEHRWSRRQQKFLGECCWSSRRQEVHGFPAEEYCRRQIAILDVLIG